MYIAPRPQPNDDPLFATRLALGCTLSILISLVVQSPMPMLLPVFIVTLQGGMRKAFDVKKAIGSPVLLMITIQVFYWMLSYLHVMPAMTILVVFLVCSVAYFITIKSGNPVGILILISMVFMSVMGAKSSALLVVVRDAFIEAAVVSLLLIPLLYGLLPSRATAPLLEEFQPDLHGFQFERAMLRSAVLMLLLGGLYTLLDQSNMVLAITAIFALIFPCKEHQYEEARERSFATLVGGAIALTILAIVGYVGHLFVLLMVIFVFSLYLSNKIMYGSQPPMVYQFALSVSLTLVVSSLNNQSPVYLTLLRIVMTLIGTVGAVFLYAVLEDLIFRDLEIKAVRAKNPE